MSRLKVDNSDGVVVQKPGANRYKVFSDIEGVPEWLVAQLDKLGIFRPTPVQAGTIPEALKGYDVIGAARTGQGKTLCFAMPILISLAADPGAFRGLVVTPTRELALQIAQQFQVFAEHLKIRISTIVGGLDAMDQQRELATKPHVVIATPGRLAELIKGGTSSTHFASFRRLKYFVLDEADRLLSSDFAEPLAVIASILPEKRQTLLFSATMTQNVKQLLTLQGMNKPHIYQDADTNEYDPVQVDGVEKWPTPETLKMEYMFMPQNVKDCYLLYLIRTFSDLPGIIVFTPSCQMCEELCMMLNYADPPVGAVRLHGWMRQPDRTAALLQFKSGQSKVLVATDLASRGLDIPDVQLVIQVNVPRDPRVYIHRVGRVARRGKQGRSILLIDQYQIDLFLEVEKHLTRKVEEHTVEEKQVLVYLNETLTARETGRLELDDTGFYDRMEVLRSKKPTSTPHRSSAASSSQPTDTEKQRPSSDKRDSNGKRSHSSSDDAPAPKKKAKLS